MQWLMIAIGGALGSMARYAAVGYFATLFNYRFPFGTFIVNMSGSFLIGLAYVLLVEKAVLPSEWRLFFITGILGGYTTFSAFSLEMLQMWQEGHILNSIFYATSSVALGLFCAYLGILLTHKFF